MDFDALFPGRFLKAGLFNGQDVTLTIAAVKVDELPGKTPKTKEKKAVLSFVEEEKELVLNKTNGICLKAMFGRETNAWVGKRVTFFPKQQHFDLDDDGEKKEVELCIRVRGSPDLAHPTPIDTKVGYRSLKTTLQKTPEPGTRAATLTAKKQELSALLAAAGSTAEKIKAILEKNNTVAALDALIERGRKAAQAKGEAK